MLEIAINLRLGDGPVVKVSSSSTSKGPRKAVGSVSTTVVVVPKASTPLTTGENASVPIRDGDASGASSSSSGAVVEIA